ncbi:MAG: hypothetical protein HYZ27_08025, partial [Deltaproteobacteria bacterium]|nr:hypothetical protein [Deltaproteobacteria bacterium]
MRGVREFLTVIAVLALAGAAQARRQSAEIIVLPWVTAAKLDHDALAGLDALLVAAARASGRDVLDASEVARSIKEPRRASLACRGSAACLAKLGRRAGVSEILYTAVEPTASGLRLLVLLVTTSGAQARGQRLVDIPARAPVEPAVSPVLGELLGLGQPAAKPRHEAPLPELPLAAIDDLDLAPLPSAPPAAPPAPTTIIAAPVAVVTPPPELSKSE